jgi:hypothetical protein
MPSDNQNTINREKNLNRVLKIVWYILAPTTIFCLLLAYVLTKSSLSLSEVFSLKTIPLCIIIISILLATIAWKIPLILSFRPSPGYTQHYMKLVLRYAVFLGISFLGLMSALFVNNGNLILPYFVLSVLGFTLNFPKQKDIHITLDEATPIITNQKKIIRNPMWLSIFSIVFILMGIVGVIHNFSKLNHRVIDENNVLIFLGTAGANLILLGALLNSRLRITKPVIFYPAVILLIGYSANQGFKIANTAAHKEADCTMECSNLAKSGQLKAGMSEDSCIQTLCSK